MSVWHWKYKKLPYKNFDIYYNRMITMPISVNLSEYKCFKEWSNLILDNKINFIFWKNWTGKSTIVKSIENQFGSEYELKIFNGYEWIIWQKEELEAIILWTENTEIQKLVEEKEKDIFNINEDLNVNSTKDNIAKKYTETNQKYIKQMDKIDTFFSKEASRIKNMDDPYISSHNYDKNNFKSELSQAKLLWIDDIKKYIKIISEEKKDDIKFQDFPTLNPDKTLKRVNNILWKSISLKIKIPELEQDENKRNFAREWIKIHKHIPWEKCAFCWNIINEDRWILLEKYFNNKVTNLEDEIDGMKQDIQSEKDLINNVELINENNFYQNFKELIKEYNNKIYKVKSEYLKFLQILESHLSDKEKHLFTKTSPITIEMPENFSEINNKYKIIIWK